MSEKGLMVPLEHHDAVVAARDAEIARLRRQLGEEDGGLPQEAIRAAWAVFRDQLARGTDDLGALACAVQAARPHIEKPEANDRPEKVNTKLRRALEEVTDLLHASSHSIGPWQLCERHPCDDVRGILDADAAA